jgi:hypothetical protein
MRSNASAKRLKSVRKAIAGIFRNECKAIGSACKIIASHHTISTVSSQYFVVVVFIFFQPLTHSQFLPTTTHQYPPTQTRRISFAEGDANKIKDNLEKNHDRIFKDMPKNHITRANELYDQLKAEMPPLLSFMTDEKNNQFGSPQERKGLEQAQKAQSELSKTLSEFQDQMIPGDGFG